jgi:hypothetical protein
MATALKKLTGVGGDVRKIARLLQAKAPEGHMLAYITPEEASVLKQRGGSGKPHADTGIPSFQQEDFYAGLDDAGGTDVPVPAEVQQQYAQYYQDPGITVDSGLRNLPEQPIQAQPVFNVQAGQDFAVPFAQPQADERAAFQAAGIPTTPAELQTVARTFGPVAQAAEPKERSILDKLSESTGLSQDTLKKLGIAGVSGLMGRSQTAAAREGAQQGRRELEAVATPYRQQGLQLQAQAQRGELTPQAQQSLQAVQAQAAQQAQRRGGVGAAQTQQQVEAFRQQLLAQQYDLGLKISGIGDQIALGAIRTGMQADQYVNQLTNSYFTNVTRALYGAAPETAQQQRGA